ncbi:MAG TPA: hypothetical protein VGB26_08555 [Nitrospiria bacterium]|jgi:hypothetical protein
MKKGILIGAVFLMIGVAIGGKMILDEIKKQKEDDRLLFASGKTEACLSCHEGSEEAHPKAPLHCTACHLGNKDSSEKSAAHQGMIENPGDLTVADQTCGTCHKEIVDRVKRSLMATRSGTMSGFLYLNGFQEKKEEAQYAFSKYEISALPGYEPDRPGTTDRLLPFPTYATTKNVFFDLTRKACMQCHLWTEGVQRKADYRGTGCSACHMTYDTEGLSQSADPTIPKNKHGHPVKHQLTTKVPISTCATCHAGGNRIAMAFMGKMEQPGRYDVLFQDLEHGHTYSDQVPDIHYEKGMVCIDCHTINEIHGDGNIYLKKVYQLEIRCETCHGTAQSFGTGITAMGNRLPNLKIEKSPGNEKGLAKLTLTSKLDGKEHPVPQIKEGSGEVSVKAHQIQGHIEKMECYACHSAWVPKCMGCHIQMDLTQQAKPIHVSYDHLEKKQSEFGLYTLIDGVREAEKDYLLGINHRGKAAPFAQRSSVVYTLIDESGKVVYKRRPQRTGEDKLGFAHNPTIPHTVRKETRSCASCHESEKALGLGASPTKNYPKLTGFMPEEFLWDRIVDERGNPAQETSLESARPFNREEMQLIRQAVTKKVYVESVSAGN